MSDVNEQEQVEIDPAEAVEKAREARKAARAKEQRKQYAIDLEALDRLEQEHGDGAVGCLSVDRDGMPTLVIVKCPSAAQVKRFRDMTKEVNGKSPDPEPAAIQVGTACLLYPDKDTFARMCAALPSLHSQAGAKALSLAIAKEHDAGKG